MYPFFIERGDIINIIFYQTTSENNQVTKQLTNANTLTGTLRDITNIAKPQILISTDKSFIPFTYCYIPDFNRYYYVSNWQVVRNNLMTADFNCDVLMSFPIRSLPAIISESENYGSNYLPSNVFMTNVKDVTDIVNFSNGLSENGEFILITAGG